MKASGMQCQDWGGKPIPDVLAGVAFNLPDICDYGNTSQTGAAAQVNIIVYKTWETLKDSYCLYTHTGVTPCMD